MKRLRNKTGFIKSLRFRYFFLVSLIFIILGIISGFISIEGIHNFSNKEIIDFKKKAYESKKEELKSAVKIALTTLKAFYSRTEDKILEKEIKRRLKYYMDIVLNIIKNYYITNKDEMSLLRIKENVIQIVKNAKYGKTGYFWILKLDGRLIMHPYKISLIGKNIINYKDAKGKRFVKEMIEVAKKYGKGFVKYYWPKPGEKKPSLKLSYVVLFKPFHWIIGTGVYIKDYIKEITRLAQKEALYTLEKVRFGKNNIGYFWIMDEKGKVLMHPIKSEIVGTVPPPAKKILQALKNKDEAFVTYKWPKPGEKTLKTKLSYVAKFKPWHWIVGSGAYIEDIEENIALMKKNTNHQIQALILKIVSITAIVFFITIIIFHKLSERTIFDRLKFLAERLKQVAQGKFEYLNTKVPEDEIGKIEKSVNEIILGLKRLSKEIERGFYALREGRRVILNVDAFSGDYKKILELIVSFYEELQKAIVEIKEFAYYLEIGDLAEISIEREGLPPVFAEITQRLEKTREKILHTMEYLKKVVNNIKEGNFSMEIEETEFSGVYKEIIIYLKQVLENFKVVLNKIEDISHQIANGNLSVKIKEEEFKGDYRRVIRYLHQIILQLKLQLEHIQMLLQKEKELAELRKLVEGDRSTEEVLQRIAYLLENKFRIKEYVFYEVETAKNHMKVVLPFGKRHGFCNIKIFTNANLCRAKRTGHLITSIKYEWGNICENFLIPDKKKYICIPLPLGEGVAYVLQILSDKEEEIKNIFVRVEEIRLFLSNILPILEVKKLLKSLEEKSLKDALTGLYNRYFLEEYILKASALALRNKTLLGIFMIDIDFFKKVNDEFGHDVGDMVLKQIAGALLQKFRRSDVVVRFGGEEFLVLLHDAEEEKLFNIAEDLRKTIEEMKIEVPGGFIRKTVSIGIAVFPTDSEDIWEVIKYADVALYHAKKTGRNKVVRFNPKMLEA